MEEKEGSDNDNVKNKDISKNIPCDISEIKAEEKSMFYSDLEIANQELNKISNKNNVYNTNTYNIKQNFSESNSYNLSQIKSKKKEDCYNDIKDNLSEKKSMNINKSNMSNIKDKSSIIILTYIWKTQMLFSGYYEFEILFTKKNTKNNKILAQRKMYRS